MAALHGQISKTDSDRGKASTVGHKGLQAVLQTWDGAIHVELRKDNTFDIFLGPHTSEGPPRFHVASGDVEKMQLWLPEGQDQ